MSWTVLVVPLWSADDSQGLVVEVPLLESKKDSLLCFGLCTPGDGFNRLGPCLNVTPPILGRSVALCDIR